ncbi:MAG: GNAT family N-acetyltransferase [Actinomycetota bacterium]
MARIEVPDELLVDELRLRPMVEADVPAVVEACQDPDIPRFTTVPSPYGEAEGRSYLEFCDHEWADGTGAPFLVVDAATDELLGSMGLMRLADDGATTELGYWIAASARGKGVATRAARVVTAAALRGGAQRVELRAMTDNVGSRLVAERVGFSLEGVLRSVMAHGCSADRIDLAIYSMLPSDPAAERLLATSAVG